jgi:hypothetical protein
MQHRELAFLGFALERRWWAGDRLPVFGIAFELMIFSSKSPYFLVSFNLYTLAIVPG